MIERAIYFFRRKIQPGYRLKPQDQVIDIGSGDKPFWRANIFFDNLSLGDNQRSTFKGTVTNIGNFVNGDITKTKFKNKIFDFSFCSHVLEHVDRPDLAIKEISRISKAGYLEVPNGLLECIQPFSTHLWFVFLSKNKLIFIRKSKKLHSILSENSANYTYLMTKIHEPFIRLYWKNNIEYEIVDTEEEEFIPQSKSQKNHEENQIIFILSRNMYLLVINILRKIYKVQNRFPIEHFLKK